jgi:hypothetical protein
LNVAAIRRYHSGPVPSIATGAGTTQSFSSDV